MTYTVRTNSKDYSFNSLAEAEDYFYASTDKHKLALLLDEYGLILTIQLGYGHFQTVTR